MRRSRRGNGALRVSRVLADRVRAGAGPRSDRTARSRGQSFAPAVDRDNVPRRGARRRGRARHLLLTTPVSPRTPRAVGGRSRRAREQIGIDCSSTTISPARHRRHRRSRTSEPLRRRSEGATRDDATAPLPERWPSARDLSACSRVASMATCLGALAERGAARDGASSCALRERGTVVTRSAPAALSPRLPPARLRCASSAHAGLECPGSVVLCAGVKPCLPIRPRVEV